MKYFLPGILLFLILGSCSNERPKLRPREAWVIRSVLDRQPRILSIALHDKLWVAYNTQTGSLFKAWSGDIKFDGPVYTSAHGPQPTTQGIPFLEEAPVNPWSLTANGQEHTPEVVYKGHSVEDNAVTVKYILSAAGQQITVEETPEFIDAGSERIGFERKFRVSEVSEGVSLKFKSRIASVTSLEDDVKSNGKFSTGKPTVEEIDGKKFLTTDAVFELKEGETSITIFLSEKPGNKIGEEVLSGEEAVFAIMARSDCNTCHNKDVKTVGPAYIEIARRYENSADKLDELIDKVIKGGAGNWGDVPMTAHPALSRQDASAMVSYVLKLDEEEEKTAAETKLMPKPDFEIKYEKSEPTKSQKEAPGIAVNVYKFDEHVADFPKINDEMLPLFSGTLNAIHFPDGNFGGLEENFAIHFNGFLTVSKTTNVVFRLVSDDGSKLYIDNKLIVDNGGNHGLDPRDGEMILKAGKHRFNVEYFQGGAGKGLSLQWRPHGSNEYSVVPPQLFTYSSSDIRKTHEAPAAIVKDNLVPGDSAPLVGVHPAFDLSQARPDEFHPKVGGIDFLPDGRMVLTTWDSLGSVFLLEGASGKDHNAIKVKRIAFGLAEPLGVKVVDNEIYVLQKQELTKLVDTNDDDIIDVYETICNGWRVSANFHEFAFGLLYKDGYFYGTLATAINPGGASTKPQIPDRGKVVKISRQDGSFSLIASGLRTPNGIGFGIDNEIYIADNQGDWLPSSKIIHLQEGAWYGSRSVDFEGTANAIETLPVVWLPQDEIGNSPSQPARLNVGPYKNQMIHGEVTHGGIKRVFAEKVNGKYQGVVFRFTQGLEAGVNRIAWGPDSALYIGGIGSTGNWSHYGALKYGLQKLKYNGTSVFEMLAVRAMSDGIEIEFTEPLKAESGNNTDDYKISQWRYVPTENYGGPKVDFENLKVKKITVSQDRRKVKLQLDGLKAKHVVYVNLNRNSVKSASDQSLWSTEAWYTMNSIPANTSIQ
jgi:cytochrome c